MYAFEKLMGFCEIIGPAFDKLSGMKFSCEYFHIHCVTSILLRVNGFVNTFNFASVLCGDSSSWRWLKYVSYRCII